MRRALAWLGRFVDCIVSLRARRLPVISDAQAVSVLFELVKVHASLVAVNSRLTQLWHEVKPMDPAIQAKLDEVKAAVVAETDQVKAKVQSIIDAVQAGQDSTEIVAQLEDIRTAIDGISEAFGSTSTPVNPPG